MMMTVMEGWPTETTFLSSVFPLLFPCLLGAFLVCVESELIHSPLL
jgi:hypothetical protein